MAEPERRTLPELERRAPQRSVGSLARSATSAAANSEALPPPAADASAAATDVPPAQGPADPAAAPTGNGAFDAVNVAYRVFNEQLQQGQQAAQLLGGALAGGLGGGASFPALSERLLRDGLLWLEHLTKVWTSLDPPGARRAEAGAAASPSRAPVSLRIASPAPVQVEVDLHPGADGRELGVHPLRAPDPSAGAIEGIELRRAAEEPWLLDVRVSPDQAPGSYSGVVYDRADGSVQGTVALRVDPLEPAP